MRHAALRARQALAQLLSARPSPRPRRGDAHHTIR
jgi:uncharacterized membrane protein